MSEKLLEIDQISKRGCIVFDAKHGDELGFINDNQASSGLHFVSTGTVRLSHKMLREIDEEMRRMASPYCIEPEPTTEEAELTLTFEEKGPSLGEQAEIARIRHLNAQADLMQATARKIEFEMKPVGLVESFGTESDL